MSAESYNRREMDAGDLTWEMITKLGRHWQETHGLKADGYIGPSTQSSLMPPEPPKPPPSDVVWTPWDGPLRSQPRSRTEVYEMFGNPGVGDADQAWVRENIIECHGNTRLPGVPSKWYVKLNKHIEPYAREALRRASISSAYEIERFGGFVFRHQRHDSSQPLSYHSWGICFDVNSSDNGAKSYKAGEAPVPWSAEWMRIWPKGVDEAFVLAMESCGFSWGGRWSTFVDPMHFQFTGDAQV